MINNIRVVFALIFSVVVNFAYSATYNQATQPWVNAKIKDLENRLSLQISGINNSLYSMTNQVEYSNSVSSAISYLTSSAASAYSSVSFVEKSTNREHVFMIVSTSTAFKNTFSSIPAVTNLVKYGTMAKSVGEDQYSISKNGITLSFSKSSLNSFDMFLTWGVNSEDSMVLTRSGEDSDFVNDDNANIYVTAIECSR